MNIKKSIPYKIIIEIINNTKNILKCTYSKIKYPKLENKIIFGTFQGSYTCNPKAIAEEIIKEKLPYTLVWAIDKKNKKEEYPKELKLVIKGTKEFYKELCTSKILIENENTFGRRYCYKKRKGQIYIQTWHGSMGIKRMCVDRGLISRIMMKKTKKYQSYVDYIISNSSFETNLYKETYWPNTKVLEYGHPRNDILFADNKKLDTKVRKILNIPKDNKIFLYAPTFREKNNKYEELDLIKIKETLEKKFKSKWTILIRTHYNDTKIFKKDGVIDATNYPDIQELMSVIDIGLTDYSSWICEFVLTRKPGFLYVPDREIYEKEDRGFYYPLEEMPFPISKTQDELEKNILNFNLKEYELKTQEYLRKRGCIENGTSSKKVVALIKEMIKNE